jgi:hypothetical protein
VPFCMPPTTISCGPWRLVFPLRRQRRGHGTKTSARYRSLSVFLVLLSVVVVTALATLAVTLRAALSSDDGTQLVEYTGDGGDATQKLHSYNLSDDNVQLFQVNGANDLEFMIAYCVELVLNYFIYYPIVGTLLFSGVLTGGRWGVWGGRPYELKEEEKDRADDMEQACS